MIRSPKQTVACPRCGSRRLTATDNRPGPHGMELRRRRCTGCGRFWKSEERVTEEVEKPHFPR